MQKNALRKIYMIFLLMFFPLLSPNTINVKSIKLNLGRSIALALLAGFASATQAQASLSVLTARVLDVKGTAQIGKMRVRQGQSLRQSDILKVSPGSSVEVLCTSNRTTALLPAGTHGNPCLPAKIQKCGGSCPRGDYDGFGKNPKIPYLITPRSTQLLNDRPLIRWKSAEGAKRYTVTVQKDGEALWTTQVTQTEVIYGGDRPLEFGDQYAVTIQADTGLSSQNEHSDDQPLPVLELLASDRQQQFQKELAQLQVVSKQPELLLLLQADLYQSYGLYSEAIAMLEPQASSHPEMAQKIGDLYQQINLDPLAITSYQQALTQTTAENWDQRSHLYHHLAHSYSLLQEPQASASAYEQAKQYYLLQGDQAMAKKVQEDLEDQQDLIKRRKNAAN
jgi:hypothetical protein